MYFHALNMAHYNKFQSRIQVIIFFSYVYCIFTQLIIQMMTLFILLIILKVKKVIHEEFLTFDGSVHFSNSLDWFELIWIHLRHGAVSSGKCKFGSALHASFCVRFFHGVVLFALYVSHTFVIVKIIAINNISPILTRR